MTPAELRAEIRRLGLSQVGAAKALGINPRTMRRYISGESEIPKWLLLALRGSPSRDVADEPEKVIR